MYFPEEMKMSQALSITMGQLRLVTQSGIKGKDDCIDGISMLGYLTPWKPSDAGSLGTIEQDGLYEEYDHREEATPLSSYIV